MQLNLKLGHPQGAAARLGRWERSQSCPFRIVSDGSLTCSLGLPKARSSTVALYYHAKFTHAL